MAIYKLDQNGKLLSEHGLLEFEAFEMTDKLRSIRYMFVSHVTVDYDRAKKWARAYEREEPGIDAVLFDMEKGEPKEWSRLVDRIKTSISNAEMVGLFYSADTLIGGSWWVPMEAGMTEMAGKERIIGVDGVRDVHPSLSHWKRDSVQDRIGPARR